MLKPRSVFLLSAMLVVSVATMASDTPAKAAPLFSSNELLEVTITAPFSAIMRSRSTEEDSPGKLRYQDPEAGEVVLDVGIRTRGRFRRQREVCSFAPLRLSLSGTKDTLFAKSGKLKLVTHCQNGSDRYAQAMLREYVAYRILNVVTDRSFRVRLLRATYVDSDSGKVVETNYAFVIERHNRVAKRLGLEVDDTRATIVGALDGEHLNLVSLFQYLIGNTDFSPIRGSPDDACCHNSVLMGDGNETLLSVPYDFDQAGLVSAPYARPNPRFKLRNVRQRLYRGRCANDEYLDHSIRTFQDARQAILDIGPSTPGLDPSSVRMLSKYIDGFYDIIDSPRQVERQLRQQCLN